MSNTFESCLAKGRLKQIEPDAERVAKELETAKEELERARTAFIARRWDEVVTQSYFAMTRLARAAVNSRGYRDTNLYGLLTALEHLLVEKGDLRKETTADIREAKDLKDSVYAGRRAQGRDARQLLVAAHLLAKQVFAMLSLPGFEDLEIPTEAPPASEQSQIRGDGPQFQDEAYERGQEHWRAQTQRLPSRGRPVRRPPSQDYYDREQDGGPLWRPPSNRNTGSWRAAD
jgi:uncharacterized protein (UPF0332 family)